MVSIDELTINSLEGLISDVISSNAGSSLLVDAALAATTLFVEDASSFDETGGQLKLNDDAGTVIDYDSCDKDLETITLSAGLPFAMFEGDLVSVYPTSTSRWATVLIPGYADPLIAIVPFSIAAQLPLGTRKAGAAETVLVTQDPNGWVVVDVLVDPVFDGTFIAPGTIPSPTFTSDGLPPSSSPDPTLEGGVGFIFAKWTAIANHDPVTYEVHISEFSGFIPDGTTLVGKTTAQFYFIKSAADGSTLQYFQADLTTEQIYYVRIIATDIDGAAAPGVQEPTFLVQASGPDMAVGSITAFSAIIAEGAIGDLMVGTLVADKISNGNLTGQLVLSGSIIAPATAGTVPGPGNTGLIIDAQGIRSYAADGTLGVNIPSSGVSPFIAGANFDVTALTIRSGYSYQDPNGSAEVGSVLVLQAGVTPPGKPALNETWPTTALSWTPGFGHVGHINGVDAICYDALGGPLDDTPVFYTLTWCTDNIVDGGVTYTQPLYLTEHLASTGVLNRFQATSIDRRLDLNSSNVSNKSDFTDYGVTRVGAYLLVLVDFTNTLGQYGVRVLKYLQSDLSYVTTINVNAEIPAGGYVQWMACSDAANGGANKPVIVWANSAGNARLRTYADTTFAVASATTTLTGGLNASAETVWGAEFDGSNWWLMFANVNGSLAVVEKFSGLVYSTGHDFTNVVTAGRGRMFGGISYIPSGDTFYSCNGNTIFKHSSKEWKAAGASPWWVGESWDDHSAHETTVGQRASILPGNRSFLAGSIDTLSLGVTGANIYLVQSATDPDITTFGHMRLQLSDQTGSFLLSAFNSVGATDPLSGNFPGTTPAEIRDVGNTWSLKGDGKFRIPFHGALTFKTATQNIASGVTASVIMGDTDYDTDNYWDVSVPTRLTVPPGLGGVYLIWGQMQPQNPTTTSGYFDVSVRKNGGVQLSETRWGQTGTSIFIPLAPVIQYLVAGDYIEMRAVNGLGASETEVVGTGEANTQLGMALLALV